MMRPLRGLLTNITWEAPRRTQSSSLSRRNCPARGRPAGVRAAQRRSAAGYEPHAGTYPPSTSPRAPCLRPRRPGLSGSEPGTSGRRRRLACRGSPLACPPGTSVRLAAQASLSGAGLPSETIKDRRRLQDDIKRNGHTCSTATYM